MMAGGVTRVHTVQEWRTIHVVLKGKKGGTVGVRNEWRLVWLEYKLYKNGG
jgi:hypothetical protein